MVETIKNNERVFANRGIYSSLTGMVVMAYFELKTPRDMLDKAEREYERMQKEKIIDHVFNYFVTASHIRDYVEKIAILISQR